MDSMAVKHVRLDFQDSKYVSINAKLYDKSSRVVEVTCLNEGKEVNIDRIKNYAFIRYRRADGQGIIDSCKITENGKIRFVLKKEMLDVAGKNYADIVLIETDSARQPIAENGFFVTDYVYNEESKSLELMFTPSPNTMYSDGILSMNSINYNGNTITLCANPAPFIAHDGNTLTFATINELGEIRMQNPSILSTMTLCVNVIDSSFYGNCVEILR